MVWVEGKYKATSETKLNHNWKNKIFVQNVCFAKNVHRIIYSCQQ